MITRAQGSTVFEIDGRPALKVYKEALGEHAEKLPINGLMFPLAVLNDTHDETGLIRTVFTVDETNQSIILAGDIAANTKIKFMRGGNEISTQEDLEAIILWIEKFEETAQTDTEIGFAQGFRQFFKEIEKSYNEFERVILDRSD